MPIFTHLSDIVGTMKINLGTMNFTHLEMMTELPKKRCIYGGGNIYFKRKVTHNILTLSLFIADDKKERQSKKV